MGFASFRVHVLEEQLRDVEIKAQTKMQEEEKKNREFMVNLLLCLLL